MSFFTKKQIKEFEEAFKDLAKKAGKEYMEHFHLSFDNEGFTDEKLEKWEKRSRKDRNKKKRGLLVKTGRLRRSLKKKVSPKRVLIYTATPYAEIHNEGGVIQTSVKVRPHKRRMKRGRKKKEIQVKAHTRRVKTTIPKRQFMGESKQVNKKLEKYMEQEFKKIFKLK